MTAQPLTAYRCDRCGDGANVPLGGGPVHTRQAGPDGWLALVIGTDPSTPPSHLCPPCAFGFKAYMADKTISVGRAAEG
jgi:hypothetical protein